MSTLSILLYCLSDGCPGSVKVERVHGNAVVLIQNPSGINLTFVIAVVKPYTTTM